MDALLAFDEELMSGDVRQAGAVLEHDDGLGTAVILSLFTDRRAEDDDTLPDGGTERRGWWGDSLAPVTGDRIGSRLWLLGREKHRADVPVRAREYVHEALQWFMDDNIARAIDITVEWVRRGVLGICIVLHKPDGTAIEYQFNRLWGGGNAV